MEALTHTWKRVLPGSLLFDYPVMPRIRAKAVARFARLRLDRKPAWETPSRNRSIAFAAFRMSVR
jgi:hypothetical protein